MKNLCLSKFLFVIYILRRSLSKVSGVTGVDLLGGKNIRVPHLIGSREFLADDFLGIFDIPEDDEDVPNDDGDFDEANN